MIFVIHVWISVLIINISQLRYQRNIEQRCANTIDQDYFSNKNHCVKDVMIIVMDASVHKRFKTNIKVGK